MQRCNNAIRAIALMLALGVVLAGCSNGYLDRRDSISQSAGDAIASNHVTQMVDPWPAHSANRTIAFNGQKMQSAVERYRNNQVISPKGIGTSGSYQPAPQNNAGGGAANPTPVGPTVTQPAAPVK
jgi:hypothetical protein